MFAYLLVIGIWMFSSLIRLRWRQCQVQKDIIRGQTAEIRCTLKRGGEFADTRYTIRYFQSDGKGLLRNDNGTVFKPNDRYPLTKDVFRLYYTSLSADRQTIDVYVEDSFGKVQQMPIADIRIILPAVHTLKVFHYDNCTLKRWQVCQPHPALGKGRLTEQAEYTK